MLMRARAYPVQRTILSVVSFLVVVSCAGMAGCQASSRNSEALFSRERIERGRDVYLSYGCAVCHGPEGDGRGISSNNISRPTDFRKKQSYRYGQARMMMRSVIKSGTRPNGGMPAFGHIPSDELDDLCEFLASLQEGVGP